MGYGGKLGLTVAEERSAGAIRYAARGCQRSGAEAGVRGWESKSTASRSPAEIPSTMQW